MVADAAVADEGMVAGAEFSGRVSESRKEFIFQLAREIPSMAFALLALSVVLYFAWRAIRSLRQRLRLTQPLEFPPLACKRRLGAPHGAAVYSPRGAPACAVVSDPASSDASSGIDS